MRDFELSKKAKADLRSIAAYTQRKWGANQRRIYLRQFDDTFHVLADSPDLGASCDHIKKGYRKFPLSSHLIFYRISSSKKIKVIRVLHKRMDVDSNLCEP